MSLRDVRNYAELGVRAAARAERLRRRERARKEQSARSDRDARERTSFRTSQRTRSGARRRAAQGIWRAKRARARGACGSRCAITRGGQRHAQTLRGERTRRRASRSYLGRARVVTFVPADLQLVAGRPARRRTFLNAALAQRTPAYYAASRATRSTSRRRARCCAERSARSRRCSTTYDERLVGDAGATLIRARARLRRAARGARARGILRRDGAGDARRTRSTSHYVPDADADARRAARLRARAPSGTRAQDGARAVRIATISRLRSTDGRSARSVRRDSSAARYSRSRSPNTCAMRARRRGADAAARRRALRTRPGAPERLSSARSTASSRRSSRDRRAGGVARRRDLPRRGRRRCSRSRDAASVAYGARGAGRRAAIAPGDPLAAIAAAWAADRRRRRRRTHATGALERRARCWSSRRSSAWSQQLAFSSRGDLERVCTRCPRAAHVERLAFRVGTIAARAARGVAGGQRAGPARARRARGAAGRRRRRGAARGCATGVARAPPAQRGACVDLRRGPREAAGDRARPVPTARARRAQERCSA